MAAHTNWTGMVNAGSERHRQALAACLLWRVFGAPDAPAGDRYAGAVARLMVNDLAALVKRTEATIDDLAAARPGLSVALGDVAALLALDRVTAREARRLLALAWDGAAVPDLLKDGSLLDAAGDGVLDAVAAELVAAHPAVAADIRAGKERAIGFLVGQGMKRLAGKADPAALGRAIRNALASGEASTLH